MAQLSCQGLSNSGMSQPWHGRAVTWHCSLFLGHLFFPWTCCFPDLPCIPPLYLYLLQCPGIPLVQGLSLCSCGPCLPPSQLGIPTAHLHSSPELPFSGSYALCSLLLCRKVCGRDTVSTCLEGGCCHSSSAGHPSHRRACACALCTDALFAPCPSLNN